MYNVDGIMKVMLYFKYMYITGQIVRTMLGWERLSSESITMTIIALVEHVQ